jgi:hypothetical protein
VCPQSLDRAPALIRATFLDLYHVASFDFLAAEAREDTWPRSSRLAASMTADRWAMLSPGEV